MIVALLAFALAPAPVYVETAADATPEARSLRDQLMVRLLEEFEG